ncbi:hypothetical protein FC16_GL002321 [Loigolactobacillus coryniformis subsp. torquens DSM 20004 = KCTC 3535]|uniref:Uncharacterized protein n=2 Tax=Loigolactobacillus coryniformis TaxID=1610 RepID=A0A2D1KP35_9LACO|nr:hypothetical protein LC20004_08200 [Loigolactobacillus coryniformis subsp. torquens DSM 20004 = KCTC 3535]KRK85305.1 hypothetical protein FC16_GL002321 [Loigolactobacillus coryniformis subsp. torquens DSM 20004 = KCTC 3535]
MDMYLDTYANWYPQNHQLGTYPRRNGARQYTEAERTALYKALTPAQQNVVADYKRRQISSAMLNISYMRDAEWQFVQRNVDPDYVRGKQAKYHCICHRPLKYQFVLRWRKHPSEVKKLGIKHFSDHLGIPMKVVSEIQAGVHRIDLAFDELLWLKQRGDKFPLDLWRRYVYAHFTNNRLAQPYKMNHHLWLRLLDFKQADMPIFILDYTTVQKEIAQVDRLVYAAKEPLAPAQKETFEHYLADVQEYSKLPLFQFKSFWDPSMRPFLTEWAQKHQAEPGDFYFRGLLKVLQSPEHWKFAWQTFPFKAGTKMVQPEVSKYLYELSRRYPLDDNFFNEIPLAFRHGLRKALRQQKTPSVKATASTPAPKKRPASKASQIAALQLYNQWRGITAEAQAAAFAQFKLLVEDDLAPQAAKQPDQIFFDKLFNTLLALNPLNQVQIQQAVQQLLNRYSVTTAGLAEQLIQALTTYQQTADFASSFQAILAPFYAELAQRFNDLP